MVNEIMKKKILEILRSEDNIVSGEEISAKIGISRVSVWKHIKTLKKLGYDIVSSPKGYKLMADFDALFPWEFKKRADYIHYFERIDSTMDYAKTLARKGCQNFTVAVAEMQEKGRGRLKRIWESQKGGLYFTIILKPNKNPCFAFLFNLTASVSMAYVLKKKFNIDVKTKWPNDLFAYEKKISGLLSEMETEADMISFLNIGMGLNVNNRISEYEQRAVSIKEILGKKVSRKDILSDFLDDFEKRIKESFDNIISQWKEKSVTLGRNVRIVTHNDVFEGLATDLDDAGSLILKLSDGSLKKIVYGDCFLL
jgi:BirA family transcriptional regulator, biotin operon repressor / biotin---[acetyl-CoA-carboxylase] ligase